MVPAATFANYDTNTTADVIVGDYAPLIKGKVLLVTGVSPKGLGAFFVEHVAKAAPSLIILAGRNAEKTQATTDAIKAVPTKTLQLDLGSLNSVKDAAKTVNSWSDVGAIDVLVNNAGIMACPYGTTPDGFEKQFGTNHLGPFLFTNLIMHKVLAAKEPRIVMVSSDGHRLSPIRWSDLDFHKGENYNPWHACGQAKTANMLMALSLAEKLGQKGLTAVSLHPGVIGTNLGAHINWAEERGGLRAVDRAWGNKEGWGAFNYKTPERGVATHVYAAFSPELKAIKAPYVLDSHIADPVKDTVKTWAIDPFEAENAMENERRGGRCCLRILRYISQSHPTAENDRGAFARVSRDLPREVDFDQSTEPCL